MPDPTFSLQILGNIRTNRAEALIGPPGDAWAVVYEDETGWQTLLREGPLPDPAAREGAIAHARERLGHYVNRRGLHPPDGLTPITLSLWLLEEDAGPAKGEGPRGP